MIGRNGQENQVDRQEPVSEARVSVSRSNSGKVAVIGFGEAGGALAAGWRGASAGLARREIAAFDVKTDAADPAVRDGKWGDYRSVGVSGAADAQEALAGAAIVFSTVTADQALAAAKSAAPHLAAAAFYFDCNSCAPGTKRAAAEVIDAAGGRYVDLAVMAPVHPALHKTAMLMSGPHTAAAAEALSTLEMSPTIVAGGVGRASSIKMLRSVMVKGLEALVAECVLAGRRAGVDDIVLESLKKTFPGFDWKARSAYMLERAMTHGIRRAAEMREVARTVAELGLPDPMSRATVEWEQAIGDLGLKAGEIGKGDYRRLADAILAALADRNEEEDRSMVAEELTHGR